MSLVSTQRLNEMKSQLPDAAEMMHDLLGCEFGHGGIAHQDDQAPCEEAAVQIVALHDGWREAHFKLCGPHRDLILSETTART